MRSHPRRWRHGGEGRDVQSKSTLGRLGTGAFASPISERLVLLPVLLAYGVVVISIGTSRSYLGYGVETDFINNFASDAVRLLAGEPLSSYLYPPLYAMLLALGYALIGDWLQVGLLLSLVSGVIALLAAFALFGLIGSRFAAWGALIGMFGSAPFMLLSAEATTDVLFLGRSSCSPSCSRWSGAAAGRGAAAVDRLRPRHRARPDDALQCGGPPAPRLCAAAGGGGWRSRLRGIAAFCAGLAVVLGIFLAFAAITGSNIWPVRTFRILAAGHFVDVPDPLSGDALVAAGAQFGSLLDVVTHDPVRLVAGYARSFYELGQQGLALLLEPPLNLLFLAGLAVLVGRRAGKALAMVVVTMGAMIMLVALAPFSIRYFLFLVPLAGAGLGELAGLLPRDPPWRRRAGIAAVCASAGIAIAFAGARSYEALRAETREITQVVPAVRDAIPAEAAVVAYKPHLAFHLAAQRGRLPADLDLAGLRTFIEENVANGSIYLLFGRVERQMRPQLAALTRPEAAPDWLEPVASGGAGDWSVYRYRRD